MRFQPSTSGSLPLHPDHHFVRHPGHHYIIPTIISFVIQAITTSSRPSFRSSSRPSLRHSDHHFVRHPGHHYVIPTIISFVIQAITTSFRPSFLSSSRPSLRHSDHHFVRHPGQQYVISQCLLVSSYCRALSASQVFSHRNKSAEHPTIKRHSPCQGQNNVKVTSISCLVYVSRFPVGSHQLLGNDQPVLRTDVCRQQVPPIIQEVAPPTLCAVDDQPSPAVGADHDQPSPAVGAAAT